MKASETMMNRLIRIVALLIPLLGAIVSFSCGQDETKLVIPLLSQSGSNQSGTAELVIQGDKIEVKVKVAHAPADGATQPAHIHFGTCGPRLGQVHYGLNPVVQGESVTLVTARLEDLRDGNNAINIHKSLEEIQVYTACGDIPPK